MLDKLFSVFRKDEPKEDETDRRPLAVAALLVEAARADEAYTEKEQALITSMLARQFALSDEDALAVRTDAEAAQAEANDMYGFSRVVKEQLDRDDKLQLIEDMWVIALSDVSREPYEEMIIRRLIGLIHLEDADSTAARRRAEAKVARD